MTAAANPAPARLRLTPRQTRLWRAIAHLEATGDRVTSRALHHAIGYSHPGGSAWRVLATLVAHGLVERPAARTWSVRIARGVSVLSDGSVYRAGVRPK